MNTDPVERLLEPERDVHVAHLMHQLVDDLGVEKLEGTRATIDQRDLDANRGEDRRVLDANDAGADDGEFAR
mgnify:CR=1 FL=1